MAGRCSLCFMSGFFWLMADECAKVWLNCFVSLSCLGLGCLLSLLCNLTLTYRLFCKLLLKPGWSLCPWQYWRSSISHSPFDKSISRFVGHRLTAHDLRLVWHKLGIWPEVEIFETHIGCFCILIMWGFCEMKTFSRSVCVCLWMTSGGVFAYDGWTAWIQCASLFACIYSGLN